MTIAATIQAAEIQAAATFNSTITAAIIGAAGIGIGVIVSWCTALHLQNRAKIKEIRSGVYLELIDSQSEMVKGLTTVLLEPIEKWSEISNLVLNFSGKVDKALFICETKNKVEIQKAIHFIGETYTQIDLLVGPIRELRNGEKIIRDKFNQLRNQISVDIEKLNSMTALGADKYQINDLIVLLRNQEAECTKVYNELNAAKIKLRNEEIKTQESINKAMDNLSIKFLPIIHLLRRELSIKTNIQLDESLYKKD